MFSSVLHISRFKMQYGKAKMGASYAFEKTFSRIIRKWGYMSNLILFKGNYNDFKFQDIVSQCIKDVYWKSWKLTTWMSVILILCWTSCATFMWKAKNGIAFYHIIYLNTLKQNFWDVLILISEFQTTSKWSFNKYLIIRIHYCTICVIFGDFFVFFFLIKMKKLKKLGYL
jgi:hypothetical protein